MGIYKKPCPFNHIFRGERILRAWYRGIKNAGPRKRAQGRAEDIPYQSISPYHHGIWRIFIECGKKTHARKSAQGRSERGPILPKSNRNFRQPPDIKQKQNCNILGPDTDFCWQNWTIETFGIETKNHQGNTGAARLLGIESTVPSPALRVALTWKQRLCRPETVDVTAEVPGKTGIQTGSGWI